MEIAALANRTKVRGRIVRIKRRDADSPTGFARRRIADGDIAAGSDERPGDAAALDLGQRLVGRQALGDATQVEPHVGPQQLGRVCLWSSSRNVCPTEAASLGQPLGDRQFVSAAALAATVWSAGQSSHRMHRRDCWLSSLRVSEHVPEIVAHANGHGGWQAVRAIAFPAAPPMSRSVATARWPGRSRSAPCRARRCGAKARSQLRQLLRLCEAYSTISNSTPMCRPVRANRCVWRFRGCGRHHHATTENAAQGRHNAAEEATNSSRKANFAAARRNRYIARIEH